MYPIFNMQDFRYCLRTSILDCGGQLVSQLCSSLSMFKGDQYNKLCLSGNLSL